MSRDELSAKLIPHLYLVIVSVTGLLLVWYTRDIFLLAFAGILLAIVIRSLARNIKRFIGLPTEISITLALILFLLLIIGISFIVATPLAAQMSQLATDLPEAWKKLNHDLFAFINASSIGDYTPEISLKDMSLKPQEVASKFGGIFTTTFGFFGNILVILFFGIALAYQPQIYLKGLISLFPARKQQNVKETLIKITETLQFWLAGKALSMTITGVLTWLGLWLLGIPMAFTLALLAALLSFIPNIGPIISAIPAILLALLKSPFFALYVALLYIFIQLIESYLITPIVQQKVISLPPALTVFMQLIMSLLVGALGLALATPLLSAIVVVMKQVYLKRQ